MGLHKMMTEYMLSLNILLDSLNKDSLESHIKSGDERKYRQIDYLPEKDVSGLDTNTIYVGKLSRALARNRETPGYHYICIRDRFNDKDETEQALEGIVLVNENISVHKLYGALQRQSRRIYNWILRMKSCLIDQGDYQDLFDISEDILENFTAAIDVSYKLIAYTKNHLSDDPINTALVEKGYHSEETMRAIQKANRFPVYKSENGIIENAPGNPTIYATVSKWFKAGGEEYTHIIMICNSRPPSPALTELFSIFLDHAEICFKRSTQQGTNRSQIYLSLFSDMSFGNLVNPRIISERANVLNIPFNDNFDLCDITFENNDAVPVGRFADELSARLPTSRIIFQNYEVIALNSYPEGETSYFKERRQEELESFFEQYGAICGTSEPFARLSDFHYAYIQAKRAQAMGSKLKQRGELWGFDEATRLSIYGADSERLFTYDEVFPHYMIHQAQTGTVNVFYNNVYVRAIERLHAGDIERGSDNVRLLYGYLISERSPTTTGKLLHMNRNNVIYRISKIEEELGMKLSDYEVHLRLIIALKYCEVQYIHREGV